MPQRIEVSRLSDLELERGFSERVQRDRALTVEVLVFLGEMIARRLFAPAGYPSMYQYCVQHCGMSADVAFKWTRAARMARRFPELLDMIDDGRLNLTAITMLSPRLNPATAPWLLPAAAGKSTRELRALLALHWPQPDAPTVLKVIAVQSAPQLPGPATAAPLATSEECQKLAARPVFAADAAAVAEPAERSEAIANITAPPRPQESSKYLLQCTLDGETYALLELARSLSVPGPDSEVVAVLKAALQEHVHKLEKRKFAATEHPRAPRAIGSPAAVQSHVKRAVWKRDRGRCSFVGLNGHVCCAIEGLEYDHVIPLAYGGDSSASNVRLRCRVHNQLEADRVLGKAFMDGKRANAREQRAVAAAT